MTDRDDYPDSPYRGRADRQDGYDYDPLTDPLPTQPPSRGRRARPEPAPNPWAEPPAAARRAGPPTGDIPGGPPAPGRRRRPGPPAEGEAGPAVPPRRSGAADALRGGRAARGGRPSREPAAPGHEAPGAPGRAGADPTQEALAALANLGGAPAAPQETTGRERPARGTDAPLEEPPRRRRRARVEEAPEPRSSLWDDAEDEPTPAFFADEPEEPRGRRARRKRAAREEARARETGEFPSAPQEERPVGRRARRRARPEPEETVDGGAFAAAPFDDVAPEPEPEPEPGFAPEPEFEPEPKGRRGRRRRAPEPDSGAFPLPEEEPRRSGALPIPEEDEAEVESDPVPEEEPTGRRGRGRRRSRRVRKRPEPEPVVEDAPEEKPEEDDYEEESLEDIAASYGDSRATRRRAKAAKQRAKRLAAAKGGGGGGAPRRRRGKGFMILLALVLMLVIAGGGFVVMRTYVFPADYAGEGSGEIVITVEEGQSGTAVGRTLSDAGVVASVRAFTNALDQQEQGLTPGTYSLAEGMSGASAVAALLDQDNRLGGEVLIREGLRSDQILEKLADNTDVSLEELEAAYEQTDELGLPDYATEGPAGYLFPATYRFEPGTEAMSILRTMVTQHRQVTEAMNLEDRAADLGYDANEIMAIASIVQAESGGVDDMAKISRVVHNRLDIDMALQMDSTCFYAIGEYGIALDNDQRAACEADTSGFDTYHKTGLIPGPFVAPGEDAIEAALEPEEGDWLYFVATDPENGVTEFTDDYDEFLVLKDRFQETWGGGQN
ncbi:endolytic transglycosylase MltG [Nocardiopsis alba]|uniref:endolytic transglycosylase MltG n=1 Tax=Nocardiopsis alba TaxID=53437 RepID=UPI00365C3801